MGCYPEEKIVEWCGILKRIHGKTINISSKRFYKTIKRSGIQISLEKKTRQISIVKEDRQGLVFFVAKYSDNKTF